MTTLSITMKSLVRRKIAGASMATKLVRVLGRNILHDRREMKKKAKGMKEPKKNKRMKRIGTVTKVGVTLGRTQRQTMTRKELRNSTYWRGRLKPKSNGVFQATVIRAREREVVITLRTVEPNAEDRVRYDFKEQDFKVIPSEELLLDLLTIPSTIIHKDELARRKRMEKQEKGETPIEPLWIRARKLLFESPEKNEDLGFPKRDTKEDDLSQELLELYGKKVTEEYLCDFVKKNNPFNFSERVSQTNRNHKREASTQTKLPPSNTFSANVSFSVIYDAYMAHSENMQGGEDKEKKQGERTLILQKAQDIMSSQQSNTSKNDGDKKRTFRQEPASKPGELGSLFVLPLTSPDLESLLGTSKVMERAIFQEIHVEISQDYKYWDDDSDEYRPLEGSLLPLWKFWCMSSRFYTAVDACWHPHHPDLIAVAYSADMSKPVSSEGLLCLYSIKNPGVPEKKFDIHSGVTCVHFHPRLPHYLAAGTMDGTVIVVNLQNFYSPVITLTSPFTGKHLLAVTQVRWIPTDPGINLLLFSTSEDGRVSVWTIGPGGLSYVNTLEFPASNHAKKINKDVETSILKGTPTCVAVNPRDNDQFLLGMDTGALIQHRRSSTIHDLTFFRAHACAVSTISWNMYHQKVFGTCSFDWTVKIWTLDNTTPLLVVDLGSPVCGLAWASYSSTVFVAVTDDGRAHVYDLYYRKCQPLCSQNMRPGHTVPLSCVAFSPFSPVILVTGQKGFVICLKLSPNLRKLLREAKNADEQKLRSIEWGKMQRIISINAG